MTTAGIPRAAWRILSVALFTIRGYEGSTFDESDSAQTVPVNAFGECASGHLAEPCRQPIDTGECCERIVHSRRQRADRNLHQLVYGEYRVLDERAVRTRQVTTVKRSPDLGCGLRRPHQSKGPARHYEVPGAVEEPDDSPRSLRYVDELLVSDELQVSALSRGDSGSLGGERVEQLGKGTGCGVRKHRLANLLLNGRNRDIGIGGELSVDRVE